MLGAWIALIGGFIGQIRGKWERWFEEDRDFNGIFKIFALESLFSIVCWYIVFNLLPIVPFVNFIVLIPLLISFLIILFRIKTKYGKIITGQYNLKRVYYFLVALTLALVATYYAMMLLDLIAGFDQRYVGDSLLFLGVILFAHGMGLFFLFFGKTMALRDRAVDT